MKVVILCFLFFVSGCNVFKAVLGGDTAIDDDFFSSNNDDPLYSNNVSASGTQDVESVINLAFSGTEEPDTCSLSNLSNLSISTPCSCSSGSCSVGLTGSPGFYGNASADFNVSNSNFTSNNSSISLYIDFVCPTGFIRIPSNSSLGISDDFCVMAYEAKNVSSVATSQANLSPWTNVLDSQAKSNCTNLGPKYDLISNVEWMVIARNIENNNSNWSGGTVGTGCIYSGNIRNRTCSYDGANPEFGTGRNNFARLFISNGEEIWDFAGNVAEIIDWTYGGSLGSSPSSSCSASGGAIELSAVSCGALSYDDYMPSNSSFGSSQEAGMFYNVVQGNARIIRGSFTGETNALAGGIYDIRMGMTDASSGGVGFRCVYRPF